MSNLKFNQAHLNDLYLAVPTLLGHVRDLRQQMEKWEYLLEQMKTSLDLELKLNEKE